MKFTYGPVGAFLACMFTTGSASEFDVLAVDDIEELFDDCHFLIDQLVIATLVLKCPELN